MKAGECLPAALKLRLSHTVGRMPPLHASLCEFSGDLKPLTVTHDLSPDVIPGEPGL